MQRLTRLRSRAQALGRLAASVTAASIAAVTSAQLLVARVPGGRAAPFAAAALALFVIAVPSMAAAQIHWARAVAGAVRLENELFARVCAPPAARRAACRLLAAAGWGIMLLLGLTLPRLLSESGLYGVASSARRGAEAAAYAAYAAGAGFAIWWIKDVAAGAVHALRGSPAPGDPWDPGSPVGARRGAGLCAGAALAVAALIAARAHLWNPSAMLVFGLLFGTLAALIAWNIVTGE